MFQPCQWTLMRHAGFFKTPRAHHEDSLNPPSVLRAPAFHLETFPTRTFPFLPHLKCGDLLSPYLLYFLLNRTMHQYKLIYFNARGRAELLRWIFEQTGTPYEDYRLDSKTAEWLKVKPSEYAHCLWSGIGWSNPCVNGCLNFLVGIFINSLDLLLEKFFLSILVLTCCHIKEMIKSGNLVDQMPASSQCASIQSLDGRVS